jgi:predicted nucleic acid-binding protein
MYLLDTVILSELRKPQVNTNVAAWIARQPSNELFASVITFMEIERGIERQRLIDPDFAKKLEIWLESTLVTFAENILPVSSAGARVWGRLQTQLQRRDYDLAIAATALEHSLQVVTRNTKDFEGTGVVTVNPFETR